ncbi:MAG: hypothetical protein WCX61_00495 [Candidatus Peribacteraceae bacterium]
MREIEPDLLFDNLPNLKKQYSSNTDKQLEKRYKQALQEYKKRYHRYKTQLEKEVRAYVRTAQQWIEQQNHAYEKRQIHQLETAFV